MDDEPRTPIRYEDFTVEVASDGRGGLHTRVLHSLAGGGSAPLEPPFAAGELAPLLERLEAVVTGRMPARDFSLGAAADADDGAVDPAAIGGRLFRNLFAGQVAERFAFSRGRTAGDPQSGLRLRILLAPDDPLLPLPDLARLPWELLYDGERRDFLGRSRLTPVVRCLDVPGAVDPPPVEPPLEVLVAVAAPRGTPALDLGEERRRIEEAWGGHPSVEVRWLPAATLEAVRDALRRGRCQVFHFMGHGDFEDGGEAGVLLFEDGAGGPAPVAAPLLAATLRDFPSLRLALLNACETGRFRRRGGFDPWTGVAGALVAAGLPAVVAMQFPVSDRAAVAFSRCFYRALADGEPVEAAVAEGRHAIYRDHPEGWEWATPVLFLRGGDGRVLRGVVSRHRVPPEIAERIADVSALVEEKTRGFVGRGFVFAAMEAFFVRHGRGYFVVEGDPGIGKTAVAAELVRRHGHVHHFNRRSDGIVRPEAFLANVCAQLVAAYRLPCSRLPAGATRDAGVLNGLLAEVSRRLGDGERCLLVVDALDESDRDGLAPGGNPLCLPAALPPGVCWLVTTRPGWSLHSEAPLGGRTIDPADPANLADVRELVESHLGRPGILAYRRAQELSEKAFVELMVERSEGNFMYLSYVLPAVERGELAQLGHRRLPSGLEGYYLQNWGRMQGADEAAWLAWKLPVLEALAVAAEPIPLDLLAVGSGVADRRLVRRALDSWRPFLHLSRRPAGEGGGETTLYRVYHQSFREFLARKVDLEAAEERLLERILDDAHGER